MVEVKGYQSPPLNEDLNVSCFSHWRNVTNSVDLSLKTSSTSSSKLDNVRLRRLCGCIMGLLVFEIRL